MAARIIQSYEDFQALIGHELGVSDYHAITQEQIQQFAEATLDRQWIHTDPQRAATGPFGGTIAHGYLTLSLIPYLWDQIVDVRNVRMMVNYGIEKLKFNQPVRAGEQVRLRARLANVTNLRGTIKFEMEVALEIREKPKPAFTATMIFLYHFES